VTKLPEAIPSQHYRTLATEDNHMDSSTATDASPGRTGALKTNGAPFTFFQRKCSHDPSPSSTFFRIRVDIRPERADTVSMDIKRWAVRLTLILVVCLIILAPSPFARTHGWSPCRVECIDPGR
jgi:hypothetical protein